jgi:mannose/fructose/N-acetylgalactosamine-specific phosphotransferase system component IID
MAVAVVAAVASMLQQAGSMLAVFLFFVFKAYHCRVR